MLEELHLTRPIIFFDLEATGVNPQRDRIVEISVVKIFPDGHHECTTRKLNPTIPIPAAATQIHAISDADVARAPTFAQIAGNLLKYFEDCDLGGYNINGFDIPMLGEEFKRAGLEFSTSGRRVVDAYAIFTKLYPRTLSAAYKFFCGKDLEDAHSAEADTLATVEVLAGELARHPELPRELDALHEFSDNRDPDAIDSGRRFKFAGDVPVVNFGKHAGTPLKQIAAEEPGFLRWILRSDFPDEVKKIASDALSGIFPERSK